MEKNDICNYIIEKVIGEGTFSKVYIVGIEGNRKALKHIRKDVFPIEIDVLSRLSHPNILHAEKLLSSIDCDMTGFGIVSELASYSLYDVRGDPMYTMTNKIKNLYEVLQGLKFLHINKILHIDIKDENILLFGSLDNPTAKLTDFGLSLYVDNPSKGRSFSRVQGSPYYTAPEILKGSVIYSTSTDIWSVGTMYLRFFAQRDIFSSAKTPKDLGFLLSQNFSDSHRRDYIRKYLLKLENSTELLKLLDGMLRLNPRERYTIDNLLKSPLFANFNGSEGEINGIAFPEIRDADIIAVLGELFTSIKYVEEVSVSTLFLTINFIYKTIDLQLSRRVKSCFDLARAVIESRPALGSEALLIMKRLNGILLDDVYYTACKNLEDLKIAFLEVILNPHIYTSVNIEDWLEYRSITGFSESKESLTARQFLESVGK